MSRVRLMVVVMSGVVCAGALVGCSSPAVEPVGLTASPTAEQEPTPTPTPTDGVQDMSDADLGIVFENLPDLDGDAADVYNSIATFEVEYWRTMTTNEVSPGFSVLASPEVLAVMQRIATNNTNGQAQIGGVLHVEIASVVVAGDTASATTCDDFREATFANASGPATPEEAGFGEPTLLQVELTRGSAEGLWVIGSETDLGAC